MSNSPVGIKLHVPANWAVAIEEFDADRQLAGAADRARQLYRAHLGNVARAVEGGPWVQTRATLRRYMIEASPDWSNATKRSRRNTLVQFFEFGVREEYVKSNTARAALPKVASTPPKPKPATDTAFLHALTGATPRVQLMVHLGNDLGLRAKEMAELHTRDLRMLAGRMTLTAHGKGNKDRTLVVPPLLASMLGQLPYGWVFPSDRHPSGHLTAPYISKLLSKALPADTTGHMLRHRFATDIYRRRGDLLLVSEMLGHSHASTTQHYVLSDNLQRMTEAIDEHARPFQLPDEEDGRQLVG